MSQALTPTKQKSGGGRASDGPDTGRGKRIVALATSSKAPAKKSAVGSVTPRRLDVRLKTLQTQFVGTGVPNQDQHVVLVLRVDDLADEVDLDRIPIAVQACGLWYGKGVAQIASGYKKKMLERGAEEKDSTMLHRAFGGKSRCI